MNSQAADRTEHSPLLSSPVDTRDSESQPDGLHQPLARKQHGRSRTGIIILVLLYLVFLDLGYELIMPAQTRVFEKIFCKQYYEVHDPSLIGSDGKGGVDERWCKVKQVQQDVAMLKGWQITFDSIGMLLFSVPWAYVADAYGRKPVILLLTVALFAKYTYIQRVCYFGGAIPLKLTWLSALHTIFGGSVTVATALVYTIISDVLPENERLSIFFQVAAAAITTQFLGSLISATLMAWDPWVPMILGLVVEFISILVLLLIPDTLGYVHDDPTTPASSSIISPPAVDSSSSDGISQRPARWRKFLTRARHSISFLASDVRILLIISTFGVHMLFLNRDVMLQYISARYGVSLAYATAWVSVRSGLAVLLCVVVLPAINLYYRNRFGSQRFDLFLAQASAVLFAVGFLGMGIAPNLPMLVSALVVNSLGWGLFSFLRSLAISLVEARQVARLNSFIGVVDTVGLMIGSPLLAALFAKGMEFGGPWFGLPFLVLAGIVAVIALVLARVHV